MYAIGFDIGSSSIKASLVSLESGAQIAVVQQPAQEMTIHAHQSGWAEQDPETWWQHVCSATHDLLDMIDGDTSKIKAVGISYQMHGLVLVDEDQTVLRPSIIWCDSRAVAYGEKAFKSIGEEKCLASMLNSPGNFTAAKLAWVKDQEPDVYDRIHKFMLPGDYIAMKLTGQTTTTISGLSEGIFWNFEKDEPSESVMEHFGFRADMIPSLVETCGNQGEISHAGALATGLAEGTPIGYRAGDQPNNALSLNVLSPGEIAATGGTSGVVYGVVDRPNYDPHSRVNGFAHVNHSPSLRRIGVLLCINGAGRMYAWLRQLIGDQMDYNQMEKLATSAPIGADDLTVLPFGNGAERILQNKDIGARVINLQLNRHDKSHLIRASLEGVAFAFYYGIEIMREMGLQINVIKVGNDNLFQSNIFSTTLASLARARIEVMATTGAVGAALAAGYGIGAFSSLETAMSKTEKVKTIDPVDDEHYGVAYARWKGKLEEILDTH